MAACSAGRPVLVEQAQQRRGDAAQVVAALGGHLQQLGAGGRDLGQRVAAAVRAGPALVLDQALQVGRILDRLMTVEAAGVAGQFAEPSKMRTRCSSASTDTVRRTWVCGTV